MAYANGLIPADAMTALSVGGFMLPAAASNFELWRAHATKDGYNLTITSAADAFRTYAIQERIFRERYTTFPLWGRPTKVWNGVKYWLKPGQATAAVPGTSNHGRGLAVDIRNAGSFSGPFYRWMAQTGPLYGFSNSEGRSINEPWHWVNDNVGRGAIGGILGSVDIPTAKPVAPIIPTSEDEEMFRIRVDAKTNGVANASAHTIFLCRFGPSGEACFRALTPTENTNLERGGVELRRVNDNGAWRDFSEYEKDVMRASIISVAQSWAVH